MLIICANEYKGRSLAGFMQYVTARLFQEYRERAYRVYVTDCLYVMANNTARFAGGTTMQKRFYDLVYTVNTPADVPDPEEIIMGIIKRAGLGVEQLNGECI